MKRSLFLSLILASFAALALAQNPPRQRGTIIRMRMAECMLPSHGLMAALSGGSRMPQTAELCPEYVLVTDKVVYAIVGKTSGAIVPLAETTYFRVQNNELLIRIDDTRHEARFTIREMILRSEWDRIHLDRTAGFDTPNPSPSRRAPGFTPRTPDEPFLTSKPRTSNPSLQTSDADRD